jgi:hypothetical protein
MHLLVVATNRVGVLNGVAILTTHELVCLISLSLTDPEVS